MALGPIETPSHEQVVAVRRFLQRGSGKREWSLDHIFLGIGESRWTILGGVAKPFAEVELQALRDEGLPAELVRFSQRFYAVQRAAGLELEPPNSRLELLFEPAFVGSTHLRIEPDRIQATFTDRFDPTWSLWPSEWLEYPEGVSWERPAVMHGHGSLDPEEGAGLGPMIEAARARCTKGLEPCRCRDGMAVRFRTGVGAQEHDTHSCHIEDHGELHALFARVLELALAHITDGATRQRLEATQRYLP